MKFLKWLLIIVVVGTVVGAVLFFVLRGFVEQVSPMPDNLGVKNGDFDELSTSRLAPCPDSPNCVSSYETDDVHGMDAMPYEGETAVVQQSFLAIIQAMPDSTLITNEPGYIHAEFRSPIWRFVDDVELYFDEEAGLIHFRSASRLGYSDMGANRERMEFIQATYAQLRS